MMLPAETYATLIRSSPILCVDVILRTPEGKYLLFRRANQPLKGEWYIVGGRVEKGEMVFSAMYRKLAQEIGPEALVSLCPSWPPKFVGFYEDFFEVSSIGPGAYHTVSLVFEATVDPKLIKLDSQHSEMMEADSLPERFVVKT